MDPRVSLVLRILNDWSPHRHTMHPTDLARSVGLSASHLYRLFKAETGTIPAGYLRATRLEHAAELLVLSTLINKIGSSWTSATPATPDECAVDQRSCPPTSGPLNSVKEIAWLVGFSSVSHFIQDFHHAYGVPPRKYRAQPSKS
jgi:AraC-like DNA-binding protein